MAEDIIWFAYRGEKGRVVGLKLEGFGFTGKVNSWCEHPQYNTFKDLFETLAKKMLEAK